MTIRLTREQLYELVWSEALVRLGKGLGISDVAIAKQCRKASIPIPERGYWNKLQARHAVVRTPLPPRDLATVDVIEMNGELKPEHRERFSGEPGIESAPEDIDVLAARFRQRLGKVTMPRDLMQGDPAIVKLLQRDEALRQKMATSSYYFDKPLFESAFERRRLRILNAIFLAFARTGGGGGHFRDREAREVSIWGSASVSIELDTPKRSNGRNQEGAENEKKLMLTALAGQRFSNVVSNWTDDEHGKLEDKLTDIVVGLATISEHESRRWKAEREEWRRKQAAEEEEARRIAKEKAEREARERVVAEQQARLDELLGEARAWKDAALIRAFADARRRRESLCESSKWVEWALAEADRIDPLVK
jgi:hypothetical protein